MLVSLSLAVAADAVSEPPTIEEILNEYHLKAFDSQTQGDTDTASTWSRRGSNAKTLEQETVDTLTDAGYEAYNVTTDNFEYLEAELNTDFAGMGLDPNGSYIVVIHGEEQTESVSTGGQSTFAFLPGLEQAPGDGGGETFFTYTYNGQTYYMRYVTVTANDNTALGMTNGKELFVDMTVDEMWDAMDKYVTVISVLPVVGAATSSLYDIFSLLLPNIDSTQPDSLFYRGATNWTVTYLEIWDSSNANWRCCANVEYATMRYFMNYTYYVPRTDHYDQETTSDTYGVVYSESYDDRELMKYRAAFAFEYSPTAGWWDMVEEVSYLYDGEIIITHQRDWLNP